MVVNGEIIDKSEEVFLNKPVDLNESQWQAVKSKNKNLLIVAGPGTGKTHTLTYRAALLSRCLKESEKILAITFTNKAAEEMRTRIEKTAGKNSDKIVIGTFHSVCLDILRQYVEYTELPKNFTLAGSDDLKLAAEELWPELRKKECFSKIEAVAKDKNFWQDDIHSPDTIKFNRWLRAKNLLDFDDLILETIRLCKTSEKVRKTLQKTYRFVFVDEYQDINQAQQHLLCLIIGEAGLITAIGDPNQAIYGFRGSDAGFFDSFKNDFSNPEILSLEDNYRSGVNLLTASSQVILKNKTVFFKPLTANLFSRGQLIIHQTLTEKGEAEYIVHQIEKLVGGTSMYSRDTKRVDSEDVSSYSFGDITVLYRLNSQANSLRKAFERSGIPYQVSQKIKAEDAEEHVCPPLNEEPLFHSEKVSLMTIHAAKGLEFSVVFIVGCEENLLPLNLPGLEGDVEEERRLFYVGMTRAKEKVYLTRAGKRNLFGRFYQNKVSRFVEDIEKDLKEYEKINCKAKARKKEDDQFKLF